MSVKHMYIAIDLKTFYASVECVERNMNPLDTNLVVADASRTEKTICLAVSPSLKAYGISGRARLFEVVSKVNEILHENGDFIIGRMGIPYREKNINIISVVLNAPSDKINSLTGKLGMLEGVSAKALYSNK